jgi:hypothetical protein
MVADMETDRALKSAAVITMLFVVTYLLLLIPDREDHRETLLSAPSTEKAFAWNRDAYWKTLEEKYLALKQTGCGNAAIDIDKSMQDLQKLLTSINTEKLNPAADEFGVLENLMFETAPLVSACNTGFAEYLALAAEMRAAVKHQSENWDMKSEEARTTLYRLLYGARGVIEELMVRAPAGTIPALLRGTDEPSATPEIEVQNVQLHSGDILVSRGGAPTSALIARGNDFPGNFSHIALVYIEPASQEARIIEAHIEIGVVISTVEQYLADKKLRLMLLRPRADLPVIINDPLLPHKAAQYEYNRAISGHVPYDFAMDYKDHTKLFCSEVASEAYERYGVNLWAGISHISSPGLRSWLASFGVKHFATQEPSDLEYDPQLRVIAEWRDPSTLQKDRLDNAVTEVMLEGAEKGDMIGYKWYLLPLSRLIKFYSMVLNLAGKAGPIPEGMSATTALRTDEYMKQHKAMGERLTIKAEKFKEERGYEAPYWELVKQAREVKESRQ